jgi:hypothetical protein
MNRWGRIVAGLAVVAVAQLLVLAAGLHTSPLYYLRLLVQLMH